MPAILRRSERKCQRNRNSKIVQIPFRPDWDRFKKATPFRRNDQMLEALPRAVVACPGNGIIANLVDKVCKMGVSVWRIGMTI
jgi:hypothetical protein